MLKSKRSKLQISLEYFLNVFTLLIIFLGISYIYVKTSRNFSEFIRHFELEKECYLVSSKLNSLFPIMTKNLTYIEEIEINTNEKIYVKNHRVHIDGLYCYTKIERVEGELKKGKNVLIIENGKIRIL